MGRVDGNVQHAKAGLVRAGLTGSQLTKTVEISEAMHGETSEVAWFRTCVAPNAQDWVGSPTGDFRILGM